MNNVGTPALASAFQRGQAMVMVVIFTAVLVICLLLVFSVGQVTTTKTKLQNTADNVAYSVALVQARDYNFSAYTNRAMVLNQVAAAHALGVVSWTRYAQATFNRSSIGGNVAYLESIGAWAGGQSGWRTPWDRLVRQVRNFRSVENAFSALLRLIAPVIDGLGSAQVAYHLATITTVAEIMGLPPGGPGNLVRENDPRARVSSYGIAMQLNNARDWNNFTGNFEPTRNRDSPGNPGQERLAHVTMDTFKSFDAFHRLRIPAPPYLTPLVPWDSSASLGGVAHMSLWHGGGTELSKDKRSWVAMDVAGAMVVVMVNTVLFGVWPIPHPVPLDYGSAMFGTGGNHSPTNKFGKNYATAFSGTFLNPWTAAEGGLAQLDSPRQIARLPLKDRGGLRDYRDVKDVTNESARPTAAFVVEVERPMASVSTAATAPFNINGPRLGLSTQAASGCLRAIAAAEPYFSRPNDLWRRADRKTERGNLFSPYWQARLTATPLLVRTGSQAAQVAAAGPTRC